MFVDPEIKRQLKMFCEQDGGDFEGYCLMILRDFYKDKLKYPDSQNRKSVENIGDYEKE